MKMNKAIKALSYFAVLCLFAGVVGFVESSKSDAVCRGVVIEFKDGDSLRLITAESVKTCMDNTSGDFVGQPMRSIDFDRLERTLRSLPHVEYAAVYTTLEHSVKVEIFQRQPLIRLLDKNGISAIMDKNGYLMPLSAETVLRLPVFSGSFGLTVDQLEKNESVTDSMASPNLAIAYELGKLIAEDDFCRAQFQQLDMEKNGDVVAIPQVGNHTIILGKNRFAEKLEMLRIFYREGMKGEAWNRYSSINLKYKDQIVCTKK
jgi:cell division protein FtsQ